MIRWPFFDPGTFWPQTMRFFLTRREQTEKFEIFWGNFPDPEVADPTWPEQQKYDLTQLGSNFWPGSITSDDSVIYQSKLNYFWSTSEIVHYFTLSIFIFKSSLIISWQMCHTCSQMGRGIHQGSSRCIGSNWHSWRYILHRPYPNQSQETQAEGQQKQLLHKPKRQREKWRKSYAS